MKQTSDVKSHSGDKPKNHECQNCERRFRSPHDLNKHRQVMHEGKQDYTCDNCFKRFGYKSSWRNHMKDNSCGIKVFKCKEYQKDFTLGMNLSLPVCLNRMCRLTDLSLDIWKTDV